jgi:hypothetical protein
MENKNTKDEKGLWEQILNDLFHPKERYFGVKERYRDSIEENHRTLKKRAGETLQSELNPKEESKNVCVLDKIKKLFLKFNFWFFPEKIENDETHSRTRYNMTNKKESP